MNKTHTPHRLVTLLVAAVIALVAPSGARAYGWPVKPFDEQHPVRGFFGDPRIDDATHSASLHFGVDVVAPNGTLVYATITGRVGIHPLHADTVTITDRTGHGLEYWHVVPAVRAGSWAVSRRTVVGRVEAPWEHVHVAEVTSGRYVNPLRRGALRPFVDRTRPEVGHLTAERAGAPVRIARLSGRVDLVVEVRDWMPIAAPAPWTGKPVMPARLRWRLVGSRGLAGRWQTALDLRDGLPRCGYAGVYAKWTRQNKPWRSGRYRVYLSRSVDTRRYADGAYLVEVQAIDMAGNVASVTHPVTIRNAA